MDSIPQNAIVGNLPGKELQDKLEGFLTPVLAHLPEKRLHDVAQMAVQAIVAAQSPVLTEVARKVSSTEETIWPTARRLCRFVWNKRFSHRELLKGLYGIAQCTVARHQPQRLIVALDPVNLALYSQTGGGIHGAQEHAAGRTWAEAAGVGLSGDHGHGGEPT